MFRRMESCWIPGLAPLCLDSSDPETQLEGLYGRLMRDIPVPDPEYIKGLTSFVADWLKENIPQSTPMSFEDWLNRTTYNEERKEELRKVYTSLKGGRPSRRQCRIIKSFIKTENYPMYKLARWINSRADWFKAWSGPLFKGIEDVVYKLPEFIKHVPVPERKNVISRLKQANVRYYSTDFTAFESHFTKEIMAALELQLYTHCLQWCPSDAKFLCSVISGTNILTTRAGVRATVQARRMSGDMCTSLGNGFSNLMLAKYLAFRQGKTLDGNVEGDDGIFATDAVLTPELYKKLGFTIKMEEVADPCSASFCGMIFAESGEIIRDPISFLSGFGWTSSYISAGPKVMQELLRAKALSAIYETPQCPIVGVLARRALRDTRGSAPRWVDDGFHHYPKDERNIPQPTFAPSPETRELFSRKYGIDPSTQVEIEKRLEAGDMNVASLLTIHPDLTHYASRFVERG